MSDANIFDIIYHLSPLLECDPTVCLPSKVRSISGDLTFLWEINHRVTLQQWREFIRYLLYWRGTDLLSYIRYLLYCKSTDLLSYIRYLLYWKGTDLLSYIRYMLYWKGTDLLSYIRYLLYMYWKGTDLLSYIRYLLYWKGTISCLI